MSIPPKPVDLKHNLEQIVEGAVRIADLARDVQSLVFHNSALLSDVYAQRNELAQVVAAMAVLLREEYGDFEFDATWQPSEVEGWPVLLIQLPTGQISYHIPQAEAVLGLIWKSTKWDGHTTEEKRQRISKYLRGES